MTGKLTIKKVLALLLAALAFDLTTTYAEIPPQRAQWEPEIQKFEAHDATNPPPQNAVLFVGSSTIRKWTTLAKDFPGVTAINRGFGGSEIDDSTAYASRIIVPYHPRIIVFYAGDNDLADKAVKRSADQVVAEYTNFVSVIHSQLPDTKIVFISIKPCIARWKLKDEVINVNKQIEAMKEPYLAFVNIYPLMLGPDGKPQKDLLEKDGLHPTQKAYDLWAPLIRPYLN